MLVVIGRIDDRMFKFTSRIQAKGKMIITDKACEFSKIKEPVVLIIPFEKVQDNGFISNTKIFFDEIFISLNVIQVVTPFINNKILNTCAFFKVPIMRLDVYLDYN